MDTARIIRIATILLMLVSVVFYIVLMVNFTDPASPKLQSIVGSFISISQWAAIIAALAAIVFSVLNLFKDAAKAKNAIIGIVVLIAVIGVSYAISSGADYTEYKEDFNVTEGLSRMVSTGLTAFFIFFLGAAASIVVTEVSKVFK